MKNKKIFYGLIILIVIIFAFLIWNTFQIQISERQVKPIKPPFSNLGKCGIENCHGLEITCGSNIPEVCTAMYASGDNCRQFANCQVINNKCQLVSSQKFNDCTSCVKKCQNEFKNDVIKAFSCESTCSE